ASRIRTIRALSASLADGSLDLSAGSDREEASRRLLALPGIGPWSNGYIRMRALGDPDIFLASDLGVKKALSDVATTGEGSATEQTWTEALSAASPWRSYLTHLLWAHHSKTDRCANPNAHDQTNKEPRHERTR